MSATEIVIPYEPRALQRELHAARKRWNLLVCHRRFGKTIYAVLELILDALGCTKPRPRFAYLAPLYRQAKEIAWDYLKHYSACVPGRVVNESELRVDFPNGARIKLHGADNPDALRGIYLDGVVLDEPAQMHPRTFSEVIRPALSDREGWALWIGTPQGKNAFYDLYTDHKNDPDWLVRVFRASETGILPQTELEAMRNSMSPEEYQQELECSFEAAIRGAYYAQHVARAEAEGRLVRTVYDPKLQVGTAWDLGIGDSTAIWFYQQHGLEVRIIDYYEQSGVGLSHYAGVLRDLKDARGYVYEDEHIAPHDIEVRELGTGKSRLETAAELGIRFRVAPKLSIEDGIEAVRMLLPRCWFDEVRCKHGIEALRQYRAEFDERRKVYRPKPEHDWTSHCVTGDTEVLTRSGTYPIIYLPDHGEVMTLCGWKPYRNPRITRRNARLVAVQFADGLSVRCTPDHLFLTESGWRFASDLLPGTQIQSSLTRSRSISTAASTAYGRAIGTTREAVRSFTEAFGNALSAPYPLAVMSTTGTETAETTASKTWSAWTEARIYRSLGGPATLAGQSILRRALGMLPLCGIGPRPVGSGTEDMRNVLRAGQSGAAMSFLASIAGLAFRRSSGRADIHKDSARQPARPLTIEGVNPLAEREDVWCITVPGLEQFSLANGAIVHNSADAFRYLAVGIRMPEKARPLKVRTAGMVV